MSALFNRLADKKNSHIIPKFMCKDLFESIEPYMRKKNRNFTYFARIIEEIHSYEDLPQKFTL